MPSRQCSQGCSRWWQSCPTRCQTPRALPKPTLYKPHPLGRPRPEADNVILLEVNACVHRLIDIIVIKHEKETITIETECRTSLHAIIDRLVLMEALDPYFNLKATRLKYSQATKRKD